ncbi:MAG TPA: tRNA (adenosine(37)-N6)-threonylcarbamoyltransferase complex transferase subunit TsaD [Terracidiphilus sp.]|nr:tRNA (adenosine(37)-N6)-threonylcarbamoyltransferase complex transferase subunit TsaD [Terracidiphilus sp.]
MGAGLILGIETSCDETAAAVVERGRRTVSSVVASQIATHARYGGVVPELASREHLRAIVPVVRAALAEAGVGFKDLDAIAVTAGPGLAGALLVGIAYAKALAFANRLPLIAVNHLEGHIHAVLLREREENAARQDEEPLLALVVSGGHTHLYLARPHGDLWSYELIGRTVDDAAGEAFDKVAKLLGLGYPGGPWIDTLAQFGDPHAIPFSFAQIKAKAHLRGKTARTKGAESSPIAHLDPQFLFSFSGIKTAVLRYVEVHGLRDEAARRADLLYPARTEGDGSSTVNPPQTKAEAMALCTQGTLDLVASFQHAVIGDLMKKSFGAAERRGASRILVTGGVAANRELRERFSHEAKARGFQISFPTRALSTDNAAMIAAAAWPRFAANEFAPADLSGDPALKLA